MKEIHAMIERSVLLLKKGEQSKSFTFDELWNRAPSPREQRLEKALREILEGFNAHTVMDIARRALADESEGK